MDVLHADLTSDNMSYLSLSASSLERSKSSERIFSPLKIKRSGERRGVEWRGEEWRGEESKREERKREERRVRRGETYVRIYLFMTCDDNQLTNKLT